MTTATAETTVDSATTVEAPAAPLSVPTLSSLTPEQRETWRTTGDMPKKQDSAPAAKKETTQADSSTADKVKTSADNASDSATDKSQKPHLKTKEDTEKRFKEITDELKTLRQQNEELKRSKPSDTRDTKQPSQPAAEAKVPALKEFLKEFFAKPDNKGKDYEVGVEAWTDARDAAKSKNLEQQVRSQIALESAQRDLSTRIESAKKTYADFEQRVQPAVEAIVNDQQIPYAVKALVNNSPVFEHLLYVLGEPSALADLVKTAKTDPTAAMRKIFLTEQLVQTELAKATGGKGAGDKAGDKAGEKTGGEAGDGKTRDASGKFVSSDEAEKGKSGAAAEPISKAPRPPSEVGGRGTASNDDVASALKANGGKLTGSTKDVLNRQYLERHK